MSSATTADESLILDEEDDLLKTPVSSDEGWTGSSAKEKTKDRFAILDDIMDEPLEDQDQDEEDEGEDEEIQRAKIAGLKKKKKSKQPSARRRLTKRERMQQEASYTNWIRNRNIGLPVAKPKPIDITSFYNNLNKKARAYTRYEKVAAEGTVPLQVPDIITWKQSPNRGPHDNYQQPPQSVVHGRRQRMASFGDDTITVLERENEQTDYEQDREVKLVIVQSIAPDAVERPDVEDVEENDDLVHISSLGEKEDNDEDDSESIGKETSEKTALDISLLDEDLLPPLASQTFKNDSQADNVEEVEEGEEDNSQKDVVRIPNDSVVKLQGEETEKETEKEKEMNDTLVPLPTLCGLTQTIPIQAQVGESCNAESSQFQSQSASENVGSVELNISSQLSSQLELADNGSVKASLDTCDTDDDDYDPEAIEDCEEILSDYESEDEAELEEDSEAIAAEEEQLRLEMEGFIALSDDEGHPNDGMDEELDDNASCVGSAMMKPVSVKSMRSVRSTTSSRRSGKLSVKQQQQQWDEIMRRKSAAQGQMVVKGRMRSSRSYALLSMGIGQSQKETDDASNLDLNEEQSSSQHSPNSQSQMTTNFSQDLEAEPKLERNGNNSESDEEDMMMNTQILLRKARRRLASTKRNQRQTSKHSGEAARKKRKYDHDSQGDGNRAAEEEEEETKGSDGQFRKRLRRVSNRDNDSVGTTAEPLDNALVENLPEGTTQKPHSQSISSTNLDHSLESANQIDDPSTNFVSYIERQPNNELSDEIMANSSLSQQSTVDSVEEDVPSTPKRKPHKKVSLLGKFSTVNSRPNKWSYT